MANLPSRSSDAGDDRSEDHQLHVARPWTPTKPPACKQCRARKVKCDRRMTGCVRCERLDLLCSYTTPQNSSATADAQSSELTQAGIKRRRTTRACVACRLSKLKCSGNHPCDRCQSQGRHQGCVFDDPGGISVADSGTGSGYAAGYGKETGSQSNRMAVENLVSPVSLPSMEGGSTSNQFSPFEVSSSLGHIEDDSSQPRAFDEADRNMIRRYLVAYFDKADFTDCVFLHRATTIAEWSQGKLDYILLKATCAAGLASMSTFPADKSTAYAWMKQVQHELVTQLGNMTISRLQALMLLINFLHSLRFTGDVWVLISMAARVAFTKRLNYERSSMDPIKQECLRRLMWSIWTVDKFLAGGFGDLTLCPTDNMHIRLPCSQHNFQFGRKSRSPFLHNTAEDDQDLNALAFVMRAYDIRDRALRYTRRVIMTGANPFLSRSQLRSLDLELTALEGSLPEELQLNDNRLMLMCHSNEAWAYMMLHTVLFSSRCDLHRFLIPGIRESVPREAAEQTPPDYIDYCHRQCLRSAVACCDFWAKVSQLETSSRIESAIHPIVIYQCAKIIDHLANLLPADGDHSLVDMKEKLTDALDLVSRSQNEYDWVASCVTDISKLILRLGTRTRSSGSPSPPATLRSRANIHRRSKHAYVPEDEEEGDQPVILTASNEPEVPQEENLPSTTSIETFSQNDWCFPLPDEQSLIEPDSSVVYGLMDYGLNTSGNVIFGEQDLTFPLDPFDLQFSAYTDAEVPNYTPG